MTDKLITIIRAFLILLIICAAIFGILVLFVAGASAQNTLMPPPQMQFFDSSGNPLGLGTITTYQSGSSTPLATCADPACIATNANPLTLDAGGRADIWLTNGSAYRILLKNAAGTTIWDISSIVGVPNFTAVTSSRILFINSSNQVTSSSLLQFDGSKLLVTGSAAESFRLGSAASSVRMSLYPSGISAGYVFAQANTIGINLLTVDRFKIDNHTTSGACIWIGGSLQRIALTTNANSNTVYVVGAC